MSGAGNKGNRRTWGWLGKALCAGILALGISAGVFARAKAPESFLCMSYSKGLYYNGFAYSFISSEYTEAPDLEVSQITWNGSSWVRNWTDVVTTDAINMDLGACVFNGLLYCFYTTTDGSLKYATVNPSNQALTGPTTIATGIAANGAAAAVFDDAIYVLVAPSSGFVSKDGTSFTTFSPHFNQASPAAMIAAVTFYPMGDDPAGILFVYNDGANPPNLRSCVITPPDLSTVTNEVILPWPSASPYLWKPIEDGNLLLGTSSGLPTPGAKAPCVQFYGMTDYGEDGEHQGRWEYNLSTSGWTFNDMTQTPLLCYINPFPWFDTMDPTSGTTRLSHIVEIYSGLQPGDQFFANRSDWMVPQYSDNNYAGQAENTANDAGTELQNLWTLVGVVLGPSPFPMNGATDACPSESPFSSVSYGKDSTNSVTGTTTSSSTISVASDSKIKGGIGELSLDLSYAHAWTSTHQTSNSISVSQFYTFGPCSESAQGTGGWAIFNAPTLLTQWYKLYAYDYDQASGDGTYVGQDLYTTVTGNAVQQFVYFQLTDPSQGQIPGLFAGMPAYPDSTAPADWENYNWDDGGSDWTVTFGDHSSPQMPTLGMGAMDQVSYTTSNTILTSTGNSNSFSITAGAKLSIAGFSEGVTVGYAGEWTSTTENESTITENVSCTLNVLNPPEPPPAGDVTYMIVQPFWLQATTTSVPWVPTNYNGDLPWCITWWVSDLQTADGARAGASGPPSSASGTIRHGGDNEKDAYTLGGGRMAWLNTDGTQTPVPITAGQFDSVHGAAVSLNGHVFPADGSKGKWSRTGDTWTYKTRKGTKNDRFTLGLDFANDTWSFDGSSKSLDQEIKSADASVKIGLSLQGQYAFTNWLKHDVHSTWSHEEKKASSGPYGVREIKGDYDSPTSVGHLALKGHIPKNVTSFGDIELRINDASVSVPLLATTGFLQALQKGGKVKYQGAGLSFDIDFGTGKWEASIEGNQFKPGMAPKRGAMRVKLLLGGSSISDQTLVLQKCTTTLSFP